MQQLKEPAIKIDNRITNLTEQQNMIMDQDQPQQQSQLSKLCVYKK